jgi:hypothetical protein
MRLLSIAVILSLLLSGCGGSTTIGFISNPGAATATGVVSIVHLSIIGGPGGTSVTVTAVTLIDAGNASDFNFCGDHVNQFPMNQSVTATFTPGSNCGTIVSVRAP